MNTEQQQFADRVVTQKACMSLRDADIIEEALSRMSNWIAGKTYVLEWGSGISTLYFPAYLRAREQAFHWLVLENNRAYFDETIRLMLLERIDSIIHYCNLGRSERAEMGDGKYVVEAAVAPGQVSNGRAIGNWDEYVSYPERSGIKFHLILVDGRVRRRCLLKAAQLLAPGGIAILHDAARVYYHCAFDAFRVHERVGDDLWIGRV